MSLAAAHLWHKPNERAAWMRRFVIVSDSSIRIYGTRNDHEQHNDPMYYIELLTTTDLINGSDNIIKQGWLVKKGLMKWNPRWCALVKYGYLNYTDPANKTTIKSIDISTSEFTLEKKNNLITWKTDKGEWMQFRSDSPSIQKNWHHQMTEVQKNCMKIREENEQKKSFNKEPTLFAFMIRKPIGKQGDKDDGTEDNRDIKSNAYDTHFFCADSQKLMEGWRKCLIEQIAHSSDVVTRGRRQSDIIRDKLEEVSKRKATHKGSAADSLSFNPIIRKPRYDSHAASIASPSESNQSRKITVDAVDYDETWQNMSDLEIDAKMKALMNMLKIPQSARPKMLSLDKKQKIKMLQQHELKLISKQKVSGKSWSMKFASYKQTNMSILQQFSVVLRDESDDFLKDFIENLGLNHLCRLAAKSLSSSAQRGRMFSTGFDIELLRVFKAIIDANEYALKSLVQHNLSIRIIVEKIDSADIKVSELALSLLVTMVGIEEDEISIDASNKILTSLRDLASSKGQRNKYKVLISHMSIKDVLNGSFQYDTYAVTLINYLIMALDDIHRRMEERRLLNALQFEKILSKLEDRTRRKYNASLSEALINQIETYKKLYETDKRSANDIGEYADTFDIDNPQDLFKKVHDQALNDGYINELVSVLKNLVVLPSDADSAWYNVSKIVNAATKPAQKEMVTEAEKNKGFSFNDGMNAVRMSVFGPMKGAQDKSNVLQTAEYPTYEALHTMLEIREAQSNEASANKLNTMKKVMQDQLEEARGKQLLLEEALLEEKSKNLSLQTQLEHLYKNGTINPQQLISISPNKVETKPVKSVETKTEDKKEIKPSPTPTAVAVDDGLGKYRKMIKFRMPQASIVNRMRQDGVDKAIIQEYQDEGTLPGGNTAAATKTDDSTSSTVEAKATKPAAKKAALSAEDEKKLAKYKRMQKMNMPKQSVINRMRQDGISADVMALLYPELKNAKKKRKVKAKPKLPPNLKPKKIIKPKNKMRQLHWTTVNPFDVDKTIWKGVDDDKLKFNTNDLEEKFCWKKVETKQDDNKAKKEEKPKNEIIRVLDTRRSYNIEIFLGRLKMDSWTLREALLSMNERALSLDIVHKLINFVPTTEEAAQLNGYENEKNLGVAEKFVKTIRTVDNNLVQRLTLWEFKLEFDELYNNEQQSLSWLRKAHSSIKKSKALKLTFTLILKIGNYMNGSTTKGGAYGFKLGSLNQLMRSRTVDNSATLMEYIYEFVSNNDEYNICLQFTKDIQVLEDATSVDIAVLRQNIAGIGSKLRLIKARMDNKQAIARMGDNFHKVMKPFYAESIKKLEKLEKLRDALFIDLKDLGIWLNEPKDANFKYLKTLNEFRQNFLRAIKSTKQRKEKLAEIEKRKKWKENQKLKKKKSVKNIKKAKKEKENIEKKTDDIDEEEQEEKYEKQNRASARLRKKAFHNNRAMHNAKDSNISDLVIQNLAAGTPHDFIQRLQARARSASRGYQ